MAFRRPTGVLSDVLQVNREVGEVGIPGYSEQDQSAVQVQLGLLVQGLKV